MVLSSESVRLTPIATEQRAGAAVLAAAAVILLAVSPLAAHGERLWHWSDLLLVVLALGGVAWLRRQRNDYENAPPAPSSAVFAAKGSVIRRQAAWGTPYLLFVLLVATSVPDFFGVGFGCAIFAVGLALEARKTRNWELGSGTRLYRPLGWSKRKLYRAP